MNDTNGIDIYLTSINELENGWLEIRSFPFCVGATWQVRTLL